MHLAHHELEHVININVTVVIIMIIIRVSISVVIVIIIVVVVVTIAVIIVFIIITIIMLSLLRVTADQGARARKEMMHHLKPLLGVGELMLQVLQAALAGPQLILCL